MKALEIVRTPKGAIGLITETSDKGKSASVLFLQNQKPTGEKNAWWDEGELEVLDSIPRMIAVSMVHPFGVGETEANQNFKISKKI